MQEVLRKKIKYFLCNLAKAPFKEHCGGLKAQNLPWIVVYPCFNLLNGCPLHLPEIRTLGNVAAYELIGVFIAAALPTAISMTII